MSSSSAAPASDLPALVRGHQRIGPLWRHAAGRIAARPVVIATAACVVLLGLLFASNLRHFLYTWSTDPNYSHGFLVPLIAIYFAREASRRGPVPLRSGAGLGVGLLVIALLGKLATILIPVGIVADLALLLGLAGLCSLVGGRTALGRFGFAIFFLIFMVPLPVALYSAIASPLQIMVSRVASNLLTAIGIPVLRQGNLMTLPGGLTMFVAEACSGMRQLTGFLALTMFVAYVSARPWWYRMLVVASSIPIAMTANVVRVILTAFIMYFVNPQYASGSFHTVEGLLMMALGLALLGAECRLLGLLAPAVRTGRPPQRDDASEFSPGRAMGTRARLALGVSLLVVGFGAQAALERASQTPRPALRRELKTLPMRIGDWAGEDKPVSPDVLERAQTDDYLSRVYSDARHPGRRLTLWINYSKHGLNLRHSPEVCLPGQGYVKVESQCRTVAISRPGRAPAPITRLGYAQGELVQGVGFWYYIFGEGALEHFVRTLPITSRSSHGRTTRGSGLTVEVFCPGESDPDGQAVRDFAGALLEALEPMLPEHRAQYYIP